MKLKLITLLTLSIFSFSACILERGDDDDTAEGGGEGGEEESETPPLTKAFNASDWANPSGAFTADMSGAVIGSSFTAVFSAGGNRCTCTMNISGTTAGGDYTATCSLTFGSYDCTLYDAPRAMGDCIGSYQAPWSYDGYILKFGNCGGYGGVYYQ